MAVSRLSQARFGAAALGLAGLVCGCDEPEAPARSVVAASSTPPEALAASASGSSARPVASVASTGAAAASATASAPVSPSASGSAAVAAGDDAPGPACGAGLEQLPFTGPAALALRGGHVEVVFNDGGDLAPVSPKSPPARSGRVALDGAAKKATSPACARADNHWFCADAAGAIHRRPDRAEGAAAAAGSDHVVAQGRPGAPLAATSIGGHPVVAFLADRKTTEGAVTLAFATVDDATPILLSEDGSGATFVTLAAHDGRAIAAYVDARRAMTPVHARDLSLEKGKLVLGKDAVSFVGEGADARTPCALVEGDGAVVGLVSIGDGPNGFGMVAVRLGSPPIDDAPTLWSRYPNGCTPAPLAATRHFPAKVVRARPIGRSPTSRRTLEIGDLDQAGAFTPKCSIADANSFSDASIEVDAQGVAWVVFTDGSGTWLARFDERAAAAAGSASADAGRGAAPRKKGATK